MSSIQEDGTWVERYLEALDSETVKVPEGLTFEEFRQFIIDNAEDEK